MTMGMATDTETVTAVTTMAMLVMMVSMATIVMMLMMAAAWKRSVAVAEVVVTGVAMAVATQPLPSVNDATFMTRIFLKNTNDIDALSGASARGRPPTTNSIRRRIDDNNVGQ